MAGSKPGPPGKPTNLRLLHGDRSDRINKSEPQPSAGELDAPEWMTDEAKEIWNRLAPDLIRKKVLTPWDVDSFAVFCDAVVQYRKASAAVATGGVLIKGRRDGVVKNPALQIVRDAAQTIRAYAGEFGLTPSARSGITLPEAGDDDLESILSG